MFYRSILTFPWIELGGRTFIKCQKTEYNATVTFHAKVSWNSLLLHLSFYIYFFNCKSLFVILKLSW